MTRIILLASASALLFSLPAAAAPKSRLALDGSLGTSGFGLHLQYKIHERVIFRGGYSYLNYDVADENYDGVDYDISIDMNTLTGTIDFHPFANGFVISGGAIGGGDKQVSLRGRFIEDQEIAIGGNIYTPEDVGVLSGQVTLDDLAPYLGIGWDGSLYSERRINFLLRAGAMFTGTPDVALSSERGLLSDDSDFQAALSQEESNLQQEIDSFEVFPVVNLGLSVRF
ncbi:MAG: hypothetical protein ACWA5T_08795 [Parvularcula sp.]